MDLLWVLFQSVAVLYVTLEVTRRSLVVPLLQVSWVDLFDTELIPTSPAGSLLEPVSPQPFPGCGFRTRLWRMGFTKPNFTNQCSTSSPTGRSWRWFCPKKFGNTLVTAVNPLQVSHANVRLTMRVVKSS